MFPFTSKTGGHIKDSCVIGYQVTTFTTQELKWHVQWLHVYTYMYAKRSPRFEKEWFNMQLWRFISFSSFKSALSRMLQI